MVERPHLQWCYLRSRRWSSVRDVQCSAAITRWTSSFEVARPHHWITVEFAQGLEPNPPRKCPDAIHFTDDPSCGEGGRMCFSGTSRFSSLGSSPASIIYLVNLGRATPATARLHGDPDSGPMHLWVPCAQTNDFAAGAHVRHG